MQNAPVVVFLALVMFSLFPKFKYLQIMLVLISLGINPIANQIGIFSNSGTLLLGNVFIHLIYPLLLWPKSILTLLKLPGIFYLILLLASFFSLLLPADGIFVSQTAGMKTILLMLGSWLWAQTLARMIGTRYGFLINLEFVKSCNLVSLIVFFFSLYFNEYYFADGRYQAAGGFNSPAILSGMIIIICLLVKEMKIGIRVALISVQFVILILTGSRSVLLATMVTIFAIPLFLIISSRRKLLRMREVLLPVVLAGTTLLTIFFASAIQNIRSFDFLSIFNSNSQVDLGTLGFRENMVNRMLGEYSSFGFKSKMFGIGAGGGTVLAMEWISSLRDSSYTSARVFHNGFLQLLIENGIFGVSIFVLIAVALVHVNREAIGHMALVWVPFFSIALFLSSNPFSSSGLLVTLIYLPFLIPSVRSL
jgi:hypothetical protein